MRQSAQPAGRVTVRVRSHCVLCGASFDDVARSPQPCRHARSGFIASRRSWCVGCDSLDAPSRAARAKARLRAVTERAARLAYLREYNARPEVRERKRQHMATKRFGVRKSFRCATCRRRFPGNREAYRMIDGARTRLHMCAFCAEQQYGPPKAKAPRIGWAAYGRERRARQTAIRGKSEAA